MAIGKVPGAALLPEQDRQGLDLYFTTNSQTLAYLDFNNFRLGVNTATPQQPLDVNGNVIVTNGFLLTSGNLTYDIGTVTNQWRNIYAGTFIGNITGNLTPGPQLGITSVGNLSNLVVIGNTTVSGNILSSANLISNLGTSTNWFNTAYISSIYGTLQTANQPNITGVGNITTGTWSAGIINSAYGGTGVNNSPYTLTFNGGNWTLNQELKIGASPTFYGNNFIASSIQNSSLANANVIVNGVTINLGSNATVSANAATLTSTTLNNNVIYSSLQTLGNLANLSVAGVSTHTGVMYANSSIASSGTTTGAIVVNGGVGVSGNINAGNVNAQNFNANSLSFTSATSTIYGTGPLLVNPTGNLTLKAPNVFITGTAGNITLVSTTLGAIDNIRIGGTTPAGGDFTRLAATGVVYANSFTSTTTTTAGALVVAGGVGIGQSIYARDINATVIGNVTPAAGDFVRLAATGIVYANSATASTNTTTGALVVTGGLGASGNVNAGNVIATNLTGTLLTASQTNITAIGNITTGTWSAGIINSAYGGSGVNNGPYTLTWTNNWTLNQDLRVGATPTFWGNNIIASSIQNSSLANANVIVNGSTIALGSNVTISANAATLTGTTLNNNIIYSSLQTVGNLANLSVNGTIQTTGVIYGNSGLSGTLLTNAQPNITSVGTLGTLNVTNAANVGALYVNGSPVSTSASNIQVTGDVTGYGNVSNVALTLVNTGVLPGVYGAGDPDTQDKIPQFTVDSKGRIITVANVAITRIGNIQFSDTTMYTTSGAITLQSGNNSNIYLTAPGTGTVQITGTDAFGIPSGTTALRPANPTTGYFRFNTDNLSVEWFDGNTWAGPNENTISSQVIDPKTYPANTKTFTLDKAALNSYSLIVSINGVIQRPQVAYTVAGFNITFVEVPDANDYIEVRRIDKGVVTVSSLAYGNTTVVLDGSGLNMGGNIIPTIDNLYTLGNVDHTWNELFVGTIKFGDVTLVEQAGILKAFTSGGAMPARIQASDPVTAQDVVTLNYLQNEIGGSITSIGNNSKVQIYDQNTGPGNIALQVDGANVGLFSTNKVTISAPTVINSLTLNSPLPISSGGTGAVTSGGALDNLVPGAQPGYVLQTGGPGSYFWANVAGTGGGPGTSTQVGTTIATTRYVFTSNAAQTYFPGLAPYVQGEDQLRVYINGVRQIGGNLDYWESSNTSFTLTSSVLAAGDVVFAEIDGYTTFVGNAHNTPITNISGLASTNVQDALAEIQASKLGGQGVGGDLTVSGNINLTGALITNYPIVVNDISNQFDSRKTVFALRQDQTSINTIVDSKDVEVFVAGRRLAPYVAQKTYPWITVYDSFKGYRVRGSNILIYNPPAPGDEALITVRSISANVQVRKYPYSATTIAFGD
jgi:hypothetical protein